MGEGELQRKCSTWACIQGFDFEDDYKTLGWGSCREKVWFMLMNWFFSMKIVICILTFFSVERFCSWGIDRIKYGCKDEEMEEDDYFFAIWQVSMINDFSTFFFWFTNGFRYWLFDQMRFTKFKMGRFNCGCWLKHLFQKYIYLVFIGEYFHLRNAFQNLMENDLVTAALYISVGQDL